MKIAVASIGSEKTSQISEVAGRAPFYLIFDQNGEIVEAIKNPFAIGGGGAGFGVAKMLADKDVDTVVAGKFGGNMIGALEERGLKYYEMTGTVEEAAAEVIKRS